MSVSTESVHSEAQSDNRVFAKLWIVCERTVFQPMSPERFCSCVVGIVCGTLFAIGLFNWLVNPYGQYSTQWFEPIVQDSRSEKMELFDRLDSPPEGLILGSSRTMKFEPSYLRKHTSMSFFNFGVNHGRPEDFLAIVRMYRDRFGEFPKLVLIGVDLASLDDVVPNDARLSSEPRMLAYARDTQSWSDEFDRYSQLLSYQQLTASIRSVWRKRSPQNEDPIATQFTADGVIRYVEREKQIENGSYDFNKSLDYNEKEFLSLFGRLNEVSAKRLGYLHETVRLCTENNCRVYLFSTVHHPRLRESLVSKTKFQKVEADALKSLAEIAQELDASFVDFGAIDRFSGDERAFVDGIHPTESNTRRMIDRLISVPQEGSYAIQ